jgi:hypothetical protein
LSSSFQQNLFGSIPSFQFYRRFSYLLFAIYVVFVKKKEGSVLGHGTTAWVPAQVPGAWLWPQYTLRYRAGTGSGSSGRPVSLPIPGRSSPPPCHRPPPARSGCADPYSPLNAGASSRSAQNGIELGRPISDGIGFPSLFFFGFLIFYLFFIWFCWFFASSFLFCWLVFSELFKF